MSELTPRQQKFIQCYRGSASRAALEAGYAHRQEGDRLMSNPVIVEAIRQRQELELQPLIMSRHEREVWLSNLILDESQSTKERLKALELLGRMNGDFIQRHEVRAVSVRDMPTAELLAMLGEGR